MSRANKIPIRKNATKPNRVFKEKIILTGGLENCQLLPNLFGGLQLTSLMA